MAIIHDLDVSWKGLLGAGAPVTTREDERGRLLEKKQTNAKVESGSGCQDLCYATCEAGWRWDD